MMTGGAAARAQRIAGVDEAAGSGGKATAGGDGDDVNGGGSAGPDPSCCCRWLTVALCAPLLLIISALGAVVWLLLLPLKLCPCTAPVACAAQLAANAVEGLLKAPLRAAMWAAGSGGGLCGVQEEEEGGKRAVERNGAEGQRQRGGSGSHMGAKDVESGG